MFKCYLNFELFRMIDDTLIMFDYYLNFFFCQYDYIIVDIDKR